MKIIKKTIKPLIGIVVLGLLIYKGGLDPKLVLKAFQDFPGFILLAFLVYVWLGVVAGIRWYIYLRAGGVNITFKKAFSLHMIGLLFVTVIPGGTGGDLIKGYYIYRDTPSQKNIALTSIVIDRVVGLYALLCWGIFGILLNMELAFNHESLQYTTYFYLVVFGIATLGVLTFFTPLAPWIMNLSLFKRLPGNKIINGLFDAVKIYRGYPKALFYGYLMTIIVHTSILFVFFFCALSLSVDLSIAKHGFIVPLLTLINGLPISPGGIGVGEGAASILYGLLDVKNGAEILALYHIIVILIALCGAPFYFTYKKKNA